MFYRFHFPLSFNTRVNANGACVRERGNQIHKPFEQTFHIFNDVMNTRSTAHKSIKAAPSKMSHQIISIGDNCFVISNETCAPHEANDGLAFQYFIFIVLLIASDWHML